jgi:NADH dehydrogenase
VKIKLNSFVKDFKEDKVILSTGEVIEARSMIWAAGVTAKPVEGIPLSSIGKGKRMIVDAYNKVEGVDDIYAIGDISIQNTDPDFPNGHPQLAQPAIQHGRHLGKNFIAMAEGKPLKPFDYYDKGTMAIIGRNRAVCDLNVFGRTIFVGGFIGLFIWLFIHLISLIGYPSKVKTLYNWIVAYLTKDQSLRMIIRPDRKS